MYSHACTCVYKMRGKGTTFFPYMKIFCKKSEKYLHNSKKSSTFAPAFAFMVVLAQLVEHRIVVPSVVGSSPTFHPKTAEIPDGISAVFLCERVMK